MASSLLLFGLMQLFAPAARAERIKDMASVQGVRPNQLIGYGLVVGLDGTGDQTTQTPFTTQSIINMLAQLGTTLSTTQSLQLKNVAAVMVTANLPPFARIGQQIDVTVSSMGNAKSLRGGTLVMTPLKGADGQIYAQAQGNLLVPGVGAAAPGARVLVNHLLAGRIVGGATVEREVPTALGQGQFVHYEMGTTDFGTTQRVVDVINREIGPGTAQAIDGRLIPGLYELCVRITNDPAMEESDSFCEEVEVEDYGTLDLVYPWDGDTIEDDRPVLSWTRLDGKPSASVPAGYRLVLVEMRPGMDANASMQVGRPLFIAPGLTSYFVPYPNGVPSLVAGKCYAWEVQRTSGASISDRTGPWSFCLRKEDAPTPNKYVDLTGHGRIAQYEVVDDHVYFRVDEPYASHELQCVVLNSDGSAMHPDGAIASERGRPALKSAGVNLYDLDLSTYHLPRGNFELVVKDAKKKEYRLGLHVTQRP